MSNITQLILPIVGFGFISYFLSRSLTEASIQLAHKLGAVAKPNERSSHQEPTPRIGGIGPIGAFLIIFPILVFGFKSIQLKLGWTVIDVIPVNFGIGVWLTVLLSAILGFADDLGKLGAIGKFIGQGIIAIIPIGFGLNIHLLEFPFLGSFQIPTFVGWMLCWSWIVLMMNVVNFMDGINGLAGRFMEIFGIFMIVVAVNLGWRFEIVWMGAIILGASTAFLPFNLGQARTFMGDCGSQALGALFACGALLIHNNDLRPSDEYAGVLFDPIMVGVIVCFPLIFDVIFTLIKRLSSGENILKAHRQHLYQRYLIANDENHEATLSFVSNFFYLAAIAAIIYNRTAHGGLSPDEPHSNHAIRLFIILIVIAAMIFQWMKVQKSEKAAGIIS